MKRRQVINAAAGILALLIAHRPFAALMQRATPFPQSESEGSMMLFDFTDAAATRTWFTLNDDVMGGISRSAITATADGTALFSGVVRFENNGGFATIQSNLHPPIDLSHCDGLALRVRGDGKRYGVYLRDQRRARAHQAVFETRAGEWLDVRLPFDRFVPTYFGRIVPGEPLDTAYIVSISLIIEYRQSGPFALEIQHIAPYRDLI